ncbi:hypothetical protein TNCV_678941 [Trichonephila clavipes]|nr:hypothetical protein TNCV_678941 [Trichonephila clavipes]
MTDYMKPLMAIAGNLTRNKLRMKLAAELWCSTEVWSEVHDVCTMLKELLWVVIIKARTTALQVYNPRSRSLRATVDHETRVPVSAYSSPESCETGAFLCHHAENAKYITILISR